jgi:hypothetical protein
MTIQPTSMPLQTQPLVAPSILARESATGVVEKTAPDESQLRETFGQFVGEAFFGQLMKAMRSNVGKPAYFHGGHAEEVFQGQLDQVLAEKISAASADRFAGPMFELFQLQRQG